MTVYCHDPPFVFLHVPRTGGISFYAAVRRSLPHAEILEADGRETHMGYWEAICRWPGVPKYCVMRSPWEIYASCYRLHQWYSQLGPLPPQLKCDESFFRNIGRMDWQDWIRRMIEIRHLHAPGGFSRTFCGPGMCVLQYADRPYERLSLILGVPLDMPRVNGGWPHPAWTPELADLVAAACHEDVERFGYLSPV